MPPKKKRLFKLYTKLRDPKFYTLELYAARFLWNNGYRCIGFNVRLEPYSTFSVVGIKTKENPSISVIDIYRDKKDFNNKAQDLEELSSEEQVYNDIIVKLAKVYNKQNKTVNFKEDEIWKYLADSINGLKEMENKTLYWHMVNSYSVANYHWVIAYKHQIKHIHLPNGWGVIQLTPDSLFKNIYKPKKIITPPYIDTTENIDFIKQSLKNKIAMALTKDVIGHDLLTTENIRLLFKYLSEHENERIKDSKIERLGNSFDKMQQKTNKLRS